MGRRSRNSLLLTAITIKTEEDSFRFDLKDELFDQDQRKQILKKISSEIREKVIEDIQREQDNQREDMQIIPIDNFEVAIEDHLDIPQITSWDIGKMFSATLDTQADDFFLFGIAE